MRPIIIICEIHVVKLFVRDSGPVTMCEKFLHLNLMLLASKIQDVQFKSPELM